MPSSPPQPNANWAGNLTYRSRETLAPTSLPELQDAVARAPSLKALGTRHCFNDIADTEAAHLSLSHLDRIVHLDPDNRTVTIEGGVRYGELSAYLHRHGFALPNLASLPHISVAGAIATATHGSGVANQSLASSLRAMDLVLANGGLLTLSREETPDLFPGAVVHLGALGVVARLVLDLQPSFEVRQDLFLDLPLDALESNFDAVAGHTYSVSLFTDWKTDAFHQVWLKTRLDRSPDFAPPADLCGAAPATAPLHPLPGHDPQCCTEQLGKPGPWHQRLPHFKLEFTPSSGAEIQTEYFLPRRHAYPALKALFALREQIAPLAFVSEVRCVAADDLWLSPAYQQDCVGIHFTWKPNQPDVDALLPALENALAPFHPRPHWGKRFALSPAAIRDAYPRFLDFQGLAQQLDPAGKFRNPFLDRLFAPPPD